MAKQKALWKQSKEELLLLIRDLTVKNEELSEKLTREEMKPSKREIEYDSIGRICESIDQLRLAIEGKTGRTAKDSETEEQDGQ